MTKYNVRRKTDAVKQSQFADIADAMFVIHAQFPHVSKRIGEEWGNADASKYLQSLMIDDRGCRQGFPQSVMLAIIFIHDEHKRQFPEMHPASPWDITNRM